MLDEGDPLIGQVLENRYRVTARLGEGGMGLVYRARHVIFETDLALKVLRSAALRVRGALARLQREAQVASAIGDPHIVDVRDFGVLPSGEPYVVMEYLDGVELASLVHAEGRLPWPRACHIADHLAQALAATHAAGIVHRDLKPENVLLVRRGDDADFAKLFDFGIARVERGAAKLTMAGEVLGTPQYMSPEQCSGRPIDHRADIYALGVLLYEMLTGVVPFDAEDLRELCLAQMYEPVFAPRKIVPEIPEALEAIVMRCLEKDARRRFGSMDAVREALANVEGFTPTRRPTPLTPRPAERPRAEREPLPTPPETPVLTARPPPRPLAWALVPIAALLGVALVYLSSRDAVAPLEASAQLEAPLSAITPARTPAPAPLAQTSEPVEPARVEPVSIGPTTLVVRADPPATVRHDGALLGVTPLVLPHPAESAPMVLTLEAEGYQPREVRVSHLTGAELVVPLERVRRAARARVPAPSAEVAPTEVATQPAEPRAQAALERRRPFLDPWGDE